MSETTSQTLPLSPSLRPSLPSTPNYLTSQEFTDMSDDLSTFGEISARNTSVSLQHIFSQLEKEEGVELKEYRPNDIIVEQGVELDHFFRLLSGSVRFERHIAEKEEDQAKEGAGDEEKKVVRSTILGVANARDRWTCFCELTVLRVQKRTSAAIIAEQEGALIQKIPREAFLSFSQKNPSGEVSFFELICVNLARQLRNLHSRSLSIGTMTKSYTGMRINAEQVIIAWPAFLYVSELFPKRKTDAEGAHTAEDAEKTTESHRSSAEGGDEGKGDGRGGMRKRGLLVLTRNFLAFVRKKSHKKNEALRVVMLKNICSLSSQREMIIVTEHDAPEKFIVFLKKTVSVRSVMGVLSTAKSTHTMGSDGEREEKGTRKEVSDVSSNPSLGWIDASEGSELVTKFDMSMLLTNFGKKKFSANDVIQAFDSEVGCVSYVVKGGCRVYVPLMGGELLELSPISEGETFGEIGVLLGTPSSAHVIASSQGCEVIQIPGSFFISEESNMSFLSGVLLSLMTMMWRRILRVEANQIEKWRHTISSSTDTSLLDAVSKRMRDSFMSSLKKHGSHEIAPSAETENVFGKWKLGDVIGKGFTGVVREGWIPPSDIRYAVKVVDFDSLNSFFLRSKPKRLEMCLQTEIRALEVLHHPNVVRLEEWFCVGRTVFLCMEMIEGGNLLEAILTKRGLEEERAKEVFFQLCSAVSYCHDKNVIHGDLKPENILIRRRDGAIKLIDFGFAHIITSNSEKPEVVGGTLSYCPPADPEITYSWDDWSCGIILFVMLTCSFPFTEEELLAKTGMVLNVPDSISDDAMDILSSLLVLNPSKRGNVGNVMMNSVWLRKEREKWIEKGKESRDRLQHVPLIRKPNAFQSSSSSLMEERLPPQRNSHQTSIPLRSTGIKLFMAPIKSLIRKKKREESNARSSFADTEKERHAPHTSSSEKSSTPSVASALPSIHSFTSSPNKETSRMERTVSAFEGSSSQDRSDQSENRVRKSNSLTSATFRRKKEKEKEKEREREKERVKEREKEREREKSEEFPLFLRYSSETVTDQEDLNKTIVDRIFRLIEGEAGILMREFNADCTLVEQGTKTDCFYRLLSGSVRFEKRIISGGVVKKATVLGSMSFSDRWPCFCELTSFGVQYATSAAIVAAEKSRVEIIPYASFLAFASKYREAEVAIYHMICVNLARLLRGLHLRELSVTTLTKSYSAHHINQEAAICSWPAAMKGRGTAGMFTKQKGYFVLSRNYITFVRQKVADQRGVVSDLADSEAHVIIAVKDILVLTKDKERIVIEDTQKQRLIVHLLNSNSVRTALGILSTARDSFHSDGEVFAPIAEGMVGGSVFTKVDLEILMDTFGCRSFPANEVIQPFDSAVSHVSYVVQGHCRVFVPLIGGDLIELLPVGEGETFGEIGVLLNSPSSAHVISGSEGCTVLQIPGSFLFDEDADLDLEFLGGVFLSLMSLMWRRILNVESNQLEKWRRNVEQ